MRAEQPAPQTPKRLAAALPTPGLSPLAAAAFALACAPVVTWSVATVATHHVARLLPPPAHVGFIGVAGGVALVLGVLALGRMRRGRGALTGALLARAAVLLGAAEMTTAGVFTVNVGWVGMVGAYVVAAIIVLYALWPRAGEPKERTAELAGCARSLWRLGQAASLYAEDHEGRLPEAPRWCDALLAYIEDEAAFRCPGLPGERCAFAFNTRLSQARLAELALPAETVLLFESAGGWNGSGGAELLPRPSRHMDGNCILFADGHVERVRATAPGHPRWEP